MSREELRRLKANREYSQAYDLFRQMCALDDVDAEVYLIGGQCAKALSKYYAAKDALARALTLPPTGDVLSTARFVYAEVLRIVGDIPTAIDQFHAFLTELPEHPNLTLLLEGPARFNLALALRQARRFEDSLDQYHIAAMHFRRESMKTYLAMALHNLAWVACLFGDAVEAQNALDEAAPLSIHPPLQWHQHLGEAFVWSIQARPFHIIRGKHDADKALQICRTIMANPDPNLPDDVRSSACWLAARTLIAVNGDPDDAEALAKAALRFASADRAEARTLHDAADILREARTYRTRFQSEGL